MAQRYIYLPDEMNACLKQEENASALIVRLLNDYYNSLKPKVELEIKNPITIMEQSVLEQKWKEENEYLEKMREKEINREIAEADLLLRSNENDF